MFKQQLKNTYPSWDDYVRTIPIGIPGLFALRTDGEILVARRGGVWYTPRDIEAERATKAFAECDAKERIQMASYPTCDECGEQHSQDVACEDVTERRMSEEQKQEYLLDQQDEAERGAPTGEFIDITPVGCQTPEGNARVNQVLQRIDQTSRRVADAAQRYVKAFDAESQTSELDELRAAIQERQSAYTEFLRAVAGR